MFSVFDATAQRLAERKIAFAKNAITSSTNDLAKNEALSISEKLKVYLAGAQTHGRGRGTRSWLNSEKNGDALMITWSFSLEKAPQAVAGPMIGLAVYQALKAAFKTAPLSIKAPNDIYLKNKKILGILLETVQSGDQYRLIIGLGLNVFSHPESVDFAGHLAQEVTLSVAAWNHFLEILLQKLEGASRDVQASHLTETQREELLRALNDLPLLNDKYTGVSPFGDLVTVQKTISWREI